MSLFVWPVLQAIISDVTHQCFLITCHLDLANLTKYLGTISTAMYWAKVLIDHPNNRDICFVVKYFEMNFGILNENTVWHQSCASAGIWYSSCSLRMRIHIKPLKCICNSRNDLNLNSNHRNVINNVFALK